MAIANYHNTIILYNTSIGIIEYARMRGYKSVGIDKQEGWHM